MERFVLISIFCDTFRIGPLWYGMCVKRFKRIPLNILFERRHCLITKQNYVGFRFKLPESEIIIMNRVHDRWTLHV